MTSRDGPHAVRYRLLRDDESSDQKPQFAAGVYELWQKGQPPATSGQPPLQRYWTRTLAVILVPSIVTAWYGVIWVALVLGTENDDAVGYRTSSGSLIFYSWFIIGVFGLSWSKFGLVGVEAAMLQTPFWRAPNLVAFLMHAETTWSSLTGWISAIRHREFHRLWSLLTIMSALPFVALPLSGLVFEISDGYVGTSARPFVVGRNTTTFNEVWPLSSGTAAENAWGIGSAPTIPGFGVVYTPREGIDRSEHSCLERVPNALPLTDSIPDMFLAPQADVPPSGKAWGLRVKYDCSIVRKASEFTILSEKPESKLNHATLKSPGSSPQVNLQTPSGHSINLFATGPAPNDGTNIWAYSEIGTTETISDMYSQRYNENYTDLAPDGDDSKSAVFEYALWQAQFTNYYDKPGKTLPFNRTIDPGIEWMGSPFTMSNDTLVANGTFFKVRESENATVQGPNGKDLSANYSTTDLRELFHTETMAQYALAALDVADPIGVRCVVSSGVGTATLDGVTTTFSNFERVEPDGGIFDSGYPAFGYTAVKTLSDEFLKLYPASHLPPRVAQEGMYRYQGYINPQALQQAVMLAYGMDALQLMYDINPGPDTAWEHPGLRSSREGKILTIASLIPGVEAGYLVLVLFCLWSGLSVVLGIVYGFRRRPSDKLDGYSVLRHGINMSKHLRHDAEISSGRSFYKNKAFKKLPGS